MVVYDHNLPQDQIRENFLGYHTSLYSLPNILDATTVFQGTRSNFEIEGNGGRGKWGLISGSILGEGV